jgi:hypothetical protein
MKGDKEVKHLKILNRAIDGEKKKEFLNSLYK